MINECSKKFNDFSYLDVAISSVPLQNVVAFLLLWQEKVGQDCRHFGTSTYDSQKSGFAFVTAWYLLWKCLVNLFTLKILQIVYSLQ